VDREETITQRRLTAAPEDLEELCQPLHASYYARSVPTGLKINKINILQDTA